MNIILFDGSEWENLRPLTLTKPFSELRIGILSFRERWMKLIEGSYSFSTRSYLSEKYVLNTEKLNLFINPSFFPNGFLVESLRNLKEGESLWYQNELIGCFTSFEQFQNRDFIKKIESVSSVVHIQHLWELFIYNEFAIGYDFKLLTHGRNSAKISETNHLINPENIFFEEGAKAEFSILNATNGPIYLGKDSEIMEGSLVRGSLALCENAKLNMGTKIYSGTTVGPHSKVGGELNNAILMGYSNKAHDGFLGNSVVGEWCNLGAGTNNSNLKNNYAEVKLWDYSQKRFINTGLQFCGLIMGDYSKSAINTQFNTGTVVGVSANIFKPGFPPNFISSFNWGGSRDSEKFNLNRSYEATSKMMERREKILTENDKDILKHIFDELTDY